MNNLTTKIIYVQPKDDDRKAWEAEESGAEQAARLILAHIEDISEISAMCNRDILERSGQIDPCDFEKTMQYFNVIMKRLQEKAEAADNQTREIIKYLHEQHVTAIRDLRAEKM